MCLLLGVWHFMYKMTSFNGINTLRPRRNEQHFADDIFKRIFFNENVWILIKISLKLVPQGPINNIPALVQIMAWRRPGDKPLSRPMIVKLPTHICVTRPQWVNTTMKHMPAKSTVSHLAFGTMTGMMPTYTSDKVLKEEIQTSNSENCILKQKVDMLGNNNRLQHNATQSCNQPPAYTIVHWRNGRPGIGGVLSGTLNGSVRVMDDIALSCEKYRAHPNFWASPRQIFKNESLFIEMHLILEAWRYVI